MTKSQRIFDRFRRLSRPVLLERWLELPVQEEVFLCPQFGTPLLARLLEDFLEVDLVDAGIAVQSADGLIIKSSFVGDENCLIVPLEPRGEISWELVRSVGQWIGSAPVVTDHVLLTTAGITEVTILRSMGMSVIATRGVPERELWEFLQEARTGVFCGELKSESPSIEPSLAESSSKTEVAEQHDATDPDVSPIAAIDAESSVVAAAGPERQRRTSPLPHVVTVIIVGWSVASLSAGRPPMLDALLKELIDSERFLGWDLSRFGVWMPSPNELEGFRFCLGRGDYQALRRLFDESLLSSLFLPVRALGDPHEPLSEPTYIQAYADYERHVRSERLGFGSAAIDAAAETLRLAIERELIAPLMEAAADAVDACESNRLMMAADLARRFYHAVIDEDHRPSASIAELTRVANAFRGLTARRPR